jgi:serine protease Do
MIELTSSLAEAASDLVQRVRRSLVVLHNGHHGVGAGIIWGRSGEGQRTLILTNYHVIAHGRQLQAELEDGAQYPARLLAQEPGLDLALLEIEATGLPAALVADSRSLRVGELVLAIGHPWGERSAVTAGMVSGLSKAEVRGKRRGERLGERRQIEIIRSDARLAPGSSGGPLVNANGGVIGINTLIVGGDQGIAIPSHVADSFVEGAMQKR